MWHSPDMGLSTDLGYRHRSPNGFQRLVQAFSSSRPGAWLFSKFLRHVDQAVLRLSRGKYTAPGVLAGLPVLDLTTTGRKSGQPRTSHLISIPVGDDLALLGTNFGQPKTPAWVLNLEAQRPTPRCAFATPLRRSRRGRRRRTSAPR
jgi:deazaflavin-dependent oxidoreductase (nitroreductase family)